MELFLKEIEEGKDHRFDARLADPTSHLGAIFAAWITCTANLVQFFEVGFREERIEEVCEADKKLADIKTSFRIF